MMLSAIKETKLEPPLDQQILILENGSRFAVRNACFAVTFKTAWFKDKSLGEGIKDLVIDLQKSANESCA